MENIRPLSPNGEIPYQLLLLADPEREVIETYVKRCRCMVMELDGQIIGAYLLLETRPATVELMNIAVVESFQGRGYGKKMLRHAIDTAKHCGYKRIEVGTGNSSLNQLALYQKYGFRITGIEHDYFSKNYSNIIIENGIQCRDMIRMAQDLKDND